MAAAPKARKPRREYHDPPEEFLEKARALANMIKACKRKVVFHTGAGVSTSASIPDFRGPQGVWTLRNEPEQHQNNLSFEGKHPTLTHLAIAELVRRGIARMVISQNVDGLHLRSGVPRKQLCELHGNAFMEVCVSCKHEVFRDFEVIDAFGSSHETGRKCPRCGGSLEDTLIDFGENLPASDMSIAKRCCKTAELAIVLGSSLKVTPACHLPLLTAEALGRLAIVNLQRTSLDNRAELRVFGPCDEFMELLMKELDIPIPKYVPTKEVIIGHLCRQGEDKDDYEWQLFVCGDCGFAVPEIARIDILFPGEDPPRRVTSHVQGTILEETSQGNTPLLIVLFFHPRCQARPVAIKYDVTLKDEVKQVSMRVDVGGTQPGAVKAQSHELLAPSKEQVNEPLRAWEYVAPKREPEAQAGRKDKQEKLQASSRAKRVDVGRQRPVGKRAVVPPRSLGDSDSDSGAQPRGAAKKRGGTKGKARASSRKRGLGEAFPGQGKDDSPPRRMGAWRDNSAPWPRGAQEEDDEEETRSGEEEEDVQQEEGERDFDLEGAPVPEVPKPGDGAHVTVAYQQREWRLCLLEDHTPSHGASKINLTVMADWDNSGRLFPGKIVGTSKPGKHDVLYDDGELELAVPQRRIFVVLGVN